MSTKQEKQAQAWSQFLDMLTPQAKSSVQQLSSEQSLLPTQQAASTPSEDNDVYAEFRKSLTEASQLQVDELVETPDTDTNVAPDDSLARFCVIESADGDWATLRMFKTAEGLARRLGSLEGDDVIVWAVFGIPLRVTKGPQRYLLLPDGHSAISLPLYDGGPVKIVETDLIQHLDVQDDGFLGPPELAISHGITSLPGKKKAKAKQKTVDDDDDDEEDEEEGSG